MTALLEIKRLLEKLPGENQRVLIALEQDGLAIKLVSTIGRETSHLNEFFTNREVETTPAIDHIFLMADGFQGIAQKCPAADQATAE